MYAWHPIADGNLPSWFLGFGVWNERKVNLAWDEACEWPALLKITPAEVIYDGVYDEATIRKLPEQLDFDQGDGFVLGMINAFPYSQYRTYVARYVRAGHVQTGEH